jgi:hypothetical protein
VVHGAARRAHGAEAAALVRLVEDELFAAPLAIALDLHSGFGFVDRLWCPHARTREPPPDLPAAARLPAPRARLAPRVGALAVTAGCRPRAAT